MSASGLWRVYVEVRGAAVQDTADLAHLLIGVGMRQAGGAEQVGGDSSYLRRRHAAGEDPNPGR